MPYSNHSTVKEEIARLIMLRNKEQRKLHVLELQKASYGISIPVHIVTQIEDTQKHIDALSTRIAELNAQTIELNDNTDKSDRKNIDKKQHWGGCVVMVLILLGSIPLIGGLIPNKVMSKAISGTTGLFLDPHSLKCKTHIAIFDEKALFEREAELVIWSNKERELSISSVNSPTNSTIITTTANDCISVIASSAEYILTINNTEAGYPKTVDFRLKAGEKRTIHIIDDEFD